MSDSPNPSPTQEVERYDLRPLRSTGYQLVSRPEGEYMRVEDHQRLLQAEVEKREEVEARLVTAEMRVEGLDVMRSNLNRQREAAESKLSSVVEELERLAINEDRACQVAWTTDERKECAVARDTLRRAAQLLRDKGRYGNHGEKYVTQSATGTVANVLRKARWRGLVTKDGKVWRRLPQQKRGEGE